MKVRKQLEERAKYKYMTLLLYRNSEKKQAEVLLLQLFIP